MSKERTMLATETKMANPDKPAGDQRVSGKREREKWIGARRTWADFPLGLEPGHACKTSHGKKVEEYLGDPEHDHRFGYDHLR
jgi:hypothetical protein